MDPLLQKLLERRKQGVKSGSLGLASDYLSMVIPCLDDAACDLSLHQDATAEQWMSAVKTAQQATVYTDPSAFILGGKGVNLAFGDADHLADLTPGACMDYVTVLTSISEDRDEDVMHPKGANIDEKMPLLYHHNPIWPIGKMVNMVHRSDSIIKIKNSIVDTAMGNDAATLLEFGALRTSHGFRAKKLSERQGKSGCNILEYDVYESSLVPIPSNADAVVTLWSRGKLKHAVNKAWGEHLKKSLATQVVGGFTPPATKSCECGGTKTTLVQTVAPRFPATKDLGIPARMGYDGQFWIGVRLSKSWEWVAEELEEDAKEFLMGNGVRLKEYASVCVLGTFEDSAIVATISGDGDGGAAFYRCEWKMVGEEPTFTGTPTAVELSVKIEGEETEPEKSKLAPSLKSMVTDLLQTKMSKMQLLKLGKAKTMIGYVKVAEELSPPTRAFAENAHSLSMQLLRDKKDFGTKVAKFTLAKLKKVKSLMKAVHASPELKEPTRVAARSAVDVVNAIINGSKEYGADNAAADLCDMIRKGETIDAGSIAALREELAAAEDALLVSELTAV
jgi:hypothetical protein